MKTLASLEGGGDFTYVREPLVEHAPSLAELIRYGGTLGLTLRAYEATSPEELLRADKTPLLLVLNEEGHSHMVVLEKITHGHFIVLDPDKGRIKTRKQKLVKRFSGAFLQVEGYAAKGEQPKHPTMLIGSNSPLSLLPMVFMASSAACFLWAPSAQGWVVLTMVLLSVASSLFLRLFLLGAMRRFDKRYLTRIDVDDPKRRWERLYRYHAYKRAAFLTPSQALGRLCLLGAALVFVGLNDLYMALFLGVGVLLFGLLNILTLPKIKKAERLAGEQESRYLSQDIPKEERVPLLQALTSNSYRYGALRMGINGFGYLLAATMALVYFFVTNGAAIFDVALLFLMQFALQSEVEQLCSIGDNNLQRHKERAYFIQHFLYSEEE